MLCVEDALDALIWAEKIGGHKELMRRSQANLKIVADWVEGAGWAEFVARDPATRSCTSICLAIAEGAGLNAEARAAAPKRIADLLASEHVAYDIKHHRAAPPGLRGWGGATVEPSAMEAGPDEERGGQRGGSPGQ